MSTILNFNDKYHLDNPTSQPNSLFSSFNYFKIVRGMQLYRYEERPPYPVLISDPTVGQVLTNMNKSDFLLYFFVMGISFLGSVALTRKSVTMMRKIKILHYNMHFFNLCALTAATSCSYYRLTGLMDNGLRWRRSDGLKKYDFTSEMEKKSIFKHFRENV
jgi:hypothetical protein